MPRVSAYPMVQVGEALGTILAHAQPLGRETVELTRARGRILAQDVTADADLPGLPRSSVDGYAVMAGDDSAELEVLEEVTAGRLGSTHVRPGAAVRIMTGGTLPPGADAVVMVEEVEETNGRALLQRRPRTGENIHPPGMDLSQGQLVLARGTRIGAAEVGLLATIGCVDVPVYRRPRVAVLATGDELVEPHQTPPPGSVRDSNRYALMCAAGKAGGAEGVFRPRVEVALGHDIRPDPFRPEYQRATVSWEDHRFVARTTGLQSSSRLMSIVGANALLELAPSDQVLPKGTMVQAL